MEAYLLVSRAQRLPLLSNALARLTNWRTSEVARLPPRHGVLGKGSQGLLRQAVVLDVGLPLVSKRDLPEPLAGAVCGVNFDRGMAFNPGLVGGIVGEAVLVSGDFQALSITLALPTPNSVAGPKTYRFVRR